MIGAPPNGGVSVCFTAPAGVTAREIPGSTRRGRAPPIAARWPYVAQGRAEGVADARAQAVLTVLKARGVAVPDSERERILAQKDAARLDRWLAKAAVAASLSEVLDDPS